MCGHAAEAHDRHVRFVVPEPVLAAPELLDDPATWMSHEDADGSVMMQAAGVGAFVRALLPIRLTGGHRLTYSVWVAVRPDDLRRAFATWWEPEYADLTLSGRLANPIPPWGLLAVPVELAVRDPDQTPCCDRSPDPLLQVVLEREWDHPTVLGTVDGPA